MGADSAAVTLPAGFVLDQAVPSAPTGLPSGFVLDQPTATPSKEPATYAGTVAHNLGNEAAGLVRGAGSIGATLATPYDLLAGNTHSIANPERRQAMDQALQTLGADPNSGFFKGGKIASEIGGTAGVGGALGAGAEAAGASPTVVNALTSGGLSLGAPAATTLGEQVAQQGLRTLAGATVGGASAGLVNPENAPTGAVIGGALPGAVQVAGRVGAALKNGLSTLASNFFGSTTGAGAESIRQAVQAGKEGSQEFLDNLRGKADFGDIVDSAKQALATMRQARAAAYRSGMVDISNDKTVLDFTPIDDAVNKIASMGSYKNVQINKNAASVVDDLKSTVEQWKGLDPAEYHTPEGLDALKQAVGDIRDSTIFGTPGRKAADQVYNAVKNEIVQQAPTYSKIMGDYQSASRTLEELQKSLSLGEKASADTAVRKLQSLMRNNVSTNYGNRLELAKQLEEQGGQEILPAIAGQTLSSWTPRGAVGAIEKAGLPGAALFAHNPAVLAAAPLTSPRIVGEGAYLLGKGLGGVQNAAQSAGNAVFGGASAPLLESSGSLLNTVPAVTLSNQAVRR